MKTLYKVLAAAIVASLTACSQGGGGGGGQNAPAVLSAAQLAARLNQSFRSGATSARSAARDIVSNPYSTSNPFTSSGTINSNGTIANTVSNPFAQYSSNPYAPYVGLSSNPYSTPLTPTSAASPSMQPWLQFGSNWNYQNGQSVYGNYLMQPNMNSQTSQCQSMIASIPTDIEYLDFMMGTLERCLVMLSVNQSGLMSYTFANSDPSILNYMGYSMDAMRPGTYGNYAYNMYSPYLTTGQASYISPTATTANSSYNSLYSPYYSNGIPVSSSTSLAH